MRTHCIARAEATFILMRSLLRCSLGGVATIAGLAVIPLFLALGIAIDTGLAYSARSKLQGAVDSVVLAGARMLNTEVEEMKAEARMFFDVNYPDDYLGGRIVDFDAGFDDATRELTVDAIVEMPTAFMRIAGIPTLTLNVSASAQQLLSGLELALVLDSTGSMDDPDPSGGTKLDALQRASIILLDTIYGEADLLEDMAVSVVPYNSVVNIGSHRTNWLRDMDDHHGDIDTDDWAGCVEARSGTRDRDDSPLSEEELLGMFWPPGNTYFNAYNDPNYRCPETELLPLTPEKSIVLDHIDDMDADGATLSLPGFVWGWRTLSPDWRDAWDLDQGPVDYNHPTTKKAIVFMTDGRTVIHPGDRYYNAYGFTEEGRLGTTDDEVAEDVVDARLDESCELAKAEGIEIFTVMYDLESTAIEQLFRNCASSPAHFFDAPDGARLEAAFSNIAGKLISLHLNQ